ncbi:MAG: SIS domain-containing protein [Candidatus Eremiobacteraeota bacterium]|nr:SIS domain-containing protein [Candidatus Eremiobacteraeota bacterium]MCW5869102.1 SIS domain-containing protein [Candidatus Eremiobacteraeota bacterium]
MDQIEDFIQCSHEVLRKLDRAALERVVEVLAATREGGGRLFCLGSGGGAGHASHAVCDFRKLCHFEAYCPTDNVSELTARINDEGWAGSLAAWLRSSRLNKNDCLMIFSVGGGSQSPPVSENLVQSVQLARSVGAGVVGIVGRDGGFTAQNSDACIVVPVVRDAWITPLTEGFQALLWHLLVSHPRLQKASAKWESLV